MDTNNKAQDTKATTTFLAQCEQHRSAGATVTILAELIRDTETVPPAAKIGAKNTIFARTYKAGTLTLTHHALGSLQYAAPMANLSIWEKETLALAVGNIVSAQYAQSMLLLGALPNAEAVSCILAQHAVVYMSNGNASPSATVMIAIAAARVARDGIQIEEAILRAGFMAACDYITDAGQPLAVLEALKTKVEGLKDVLKSWILPDDASVPQKAKKVINLPDF